MVPVHYTWDEIPYPSGPEIQQIDGHLFAYWYKGPQLEGYAIPLKPRPSADPTNSRTPYSFHKVDLAYLLTSSGSFSQPAIPTFSSYSKNTLSSSAENQPSKNRSKDWRQEEKGMTEDKMVGWHYWLSGPVGASSGRRRRSGKPGVLQSMGSQRGGHEWVTEQQQQAGKWICRSPSW